MPPISSLSALVLDVGDSGWADGVADGEDRVVDEARVPKGETRIPVSLSLPRPGTLRDCRSITAVTGAATVVGVAGVAVGAVVGGSAVVRVGVASIGTVTVGGAGCVAVAMGADAKPLAAGAETIGCTGGGGGTIAAAGCVVGACETTGALIGAGGTVAGTAAATTGAAGTCGVRCVTVMTIAAASPTTMTAPPMNHHNDATTSVATCETDTAPFPGAPGTAAACAVSSGRGLFARRR